LGAYLGIGGLFMVGVVIVGISGMPMYGFDSSNWQHWMGYVTLFFSPLGFPLVLGTPVVALADVVRRPWRLHGADKSGAIG